MEARKIHTIDYKKGPRGLALKRINGAWITSTMKNEQVFKSKALSIKSDRQLPRIGYEKRVIGKTTIMTYVKAVEAKRLLDSKERSITDIARSHGICLKSLHRVYELLLYKGPDGFVEYGEEV